MRPFREPTGKCRRALGGAALLLILLVAAGCSWGKRGVPPATGREIAPADNAAGATASPEMPGVVPLPEAGTDNGTAGTPAAPVERETAVAEEGVPQGVPALAAEEAPAPAAVDNATAPKAAAPSKGPPPESSAASRKGVQAPPIVPPVAAGPAWTRTKEELVYRVDFIGITMGYARFRYEGKVSVSGKVMHHLNVRAWTSGLLAYIYPVNETIDYYMDTETLAPLRQEYTKREKEKDDVVFYDQETGKITYRYRESGEIHKRVNAVPSVYDPVTAAYYFRWRDLGGEERARNVYAGRKVWQISARVLGNERLRTERGELDTIVIQPVIRQGGKVQDKGDLRMWLSADDRHIPVRIYAKFTKIKEWTLVGELMSPKEGG